MLRTAVILGLLPSSLGLSSCANSNSLQLPLTSVRNVQMPHETSPRSATFDLLTIDSRRARLYVPHTSNSELDVVDTRAQKLVGVIPGLPGVRGVALTPDPDVVFATESTGGAVAVIDMNLMKVVASLPVNGAPDATGYDAADDVVLATSSGANEITVIDWTARKVKATIALPGSPELMAIDGTAGIAYVAIGDKSEVAAITVATKQTALFKGCDLNSPTGIALDDNGHLFVANSRLLSVIDVLVDRCLGDVDIGTGVDQLAVNLHRHHLYSANGGSRNLSVVDTRTFQPLGVVGTGPSGDGVAADSSSDYVYVMIGRSGILAVYHDP